MPFYIVPVAELRALVDPLAGSMWQCEPISVEEILDAADKGLTTDQSWNAVKDKLPPELQRTFHIARIAHLVLNPAPDTPNPMMISLAPERTWVFDGNHRLAAAIARGETSLRIGMAASDPALIGERFPGAVLVD